MPTGQILLLFLFSKMYYILLIFNKYEKLIISQLGIDKPEHIFHLNRRDKQVATSAGISAFGCVVSHADTGSSFLGHCYHISICLFLNQSSDSHFKLPPVLRTILPPIFCNIIYRNGYLQLNHSRCKFLAWRMNWVMDGIHEYKLGFLYT